MLNFNSYLSFNLFSPETNVVVLVVQLTSRSGFNILPIERTDSSSSSSEILKAIRRSYAKIKWLQVLLLFSSKDMACLLPRKLAPLGNMEIWIFHIRAAVDKAPNSKLSVISFDGCVFTALPDLKGPREGTFKYTVTIWIMFNQIFWKNETKSLLCWPALSPQMAGTTLSAPMTLNTSVAQLPSAFGWLMLNEVKSKLQRN